MELQLIWVQKIVLLTYVKKLSDAVDTAYL